jgi:hypothetical protein
MIPIQSMQISRTSEELGAIICDLKPKRLETKTPKVRSEGRRLKRKYGTKLFLYRKGYEQGAYFVGLTAEQIRTYTGLGCISNMLIPEYIKTQEDFIAFLKKGKYGVFQEYGSLRPSELAEQVGQKLCNGLARKLERLQIKPETVKNGLPAYSKQQVDTVLSKLSE